MKLEDENAALRLILRRMSARIPTEIISDSSGGSEIFEEGVDSMVTNTAYHQIDSMFASKYYFMSNVINFQIFETIRKLEIFIHKSFLFSEKW